MTTPADGSPSGAPDELGVLLLQGHDLITRSTQAHVDAWGLGRADRWSLDQRTGRIVWTFADHTASADAQILGSWNSEVGSFAWAWDNASVEPRLREAAGRVRAWGEQHGVPALTTSPLALAEDQARDLVALAFRVGGLTGLYHPYDGRLATYVAFGDVDVEGPGDHRDTVRFSAS